MFLVGLAFIVFVMLAAVLAQAFGYPRPFLVHGVLLLGALPLMWSAMLHFVPVLTRSAAAPKPLLVLPVIGFSIGLLVLAVFSGEVSRHVLLAAATLLIMGAVLMAGWLWQRGRKALSRPHPGLHWYLAAIACLLLGLASVSGMVFEGDRYPAWYGAHLHLNLFGWIGLTVLGTVPVLLPTCLQKFDPDAAFRLRLGLPWAVFGVLAIGLGAALKQPVLGAFGALALIALLGWHVRAWLLLYGAPWRWPGPAVSLLIGVTFLIGLLALGVIHGAVGRGGGKLLPAFVAGFLLPIVLGAMAQLLPVWRFPGPDSRARQEFAGILSRAAGWRATLCLAGAIGALFGQFFMLGVTALSLLWMLSAILFGLWASRAGSTRRPPAL